MKKADILLIGLILCTITSLMWELYSSPQTVTTASIEAMPVNTLVFLQGQPINIRKHDDSLNFHINGIEVRATSIYLVEKSGISVEGHVSNYNNKTYVEALRIIHAP